MLEIIIGREAGKEKPRLALTNAGKISYYGAPGSVPRSVSRNHCRLVIGDDASISVGDLTENNFMYVNGVDCKVKGNLTAADVVELGPDRYRLDIPVLIKAFSSMQTYRIGHLQEIYEKYHQARLSNQIRQGKLNALSALPGVLSMSSMVLAFFLDDKVRILMIVLAAIFAVGVVIVRMKNSTRNPLYMKQIEDGFHDEYCCPNPFCQHFLGSMPYKDLVKNQACPYCKAKYAE